MAVNYNDERFDQVESDKKQALNELEQTYSGMTSEAESYYQAQIDASKQWADQQQQIQQEQTNFTIEQIEQQKDKAQKDYIKEQSGAYVDWQKQSNDYGANAEAMASQGMTNTGYAESSQVSMYNTYQNRVATAREVYNLAVLNYNNGIKEAQLQNNAALAEIQFKALQQQLELALQGFQYKNSLLLDQANKKLELENAYYQRYQDVLAQINHENAMEEQIRQYNEQMAEEIRQYNESLAFQKQQLEEEQRQFNETMAYNQSKSSGGGGGGSSSGSSSGSSGGIVLQNNPAVGGTVPTSNPTPTNNMQSILDLGYGPISETKLASLLASGEVGRTLKDGQYYYYKKPSSSGSMATSNMLKNMGLSTR